MAAQPHPKQASDLLKPADRQLTYVSIALAICCLLPLSVPGLPTALNAPVMHAIPWPVAILAVIASVFIYYAIMVNQLVRYQDHLRAQRRKMEKEALGHFTSQVWFRAEGSGSVWEVVNSSRFPWTNARIFIEREIDGHKQFEKHNLGRLGMRKSTIVQSRLATSPMAFWRVMVVSDQGRKVDFPDEGLDQHHSAQF